MSRQGTPRQRQCAEFEAWFLAEWEQLDDENRRALADLVIGLHEARVRHNPAAVKWLAERGYRGGSKPFLARPTSGRTPREP